MVMVGRTPRQEQPVTEPRPPRRIARHRRRRRDDGAALVEFALVAMPLFLVLFATIEFGWAFFQLNDVRHGAREGIRLVAVDADPTPANIAPTAPQGKRIAQAACERMDRRQGVTISITLDDVDGNGILEVGDDATLVATKPLEQLTNVFANVLNGVMLDETITTRLEQNPHSSVHGTVHSCV